MILTWLSGEDCRRIKLAEIREKIPIETQLHAALQDHRDPPDPKRVELSARAPGYVAPLSQD